MNRDERLAADVREGWEESLATALETSAGGGGSNTNGTGGKEGPAEGTKEDARVENLRRFLTPITNDEAMETDVRYPTCSISVPNDCRFSAEWSPP